MPRPLILITNDDGINSPGLRAAAEAVVELGDVICVAPQSQQTSMSRSFPRDPKNGSVTSSVIKIGKYEVPTFGVFGSPALAVTHALLELCPRTPSLCISGINYGENIGLSLLVSGTLGAAFEVNAYDIPAIAVSLGAPIAMQHNSDYPELEWKATKHFVSIFAEKLLKGVLPKEFAVLNINVPHEATLETPYEITRQSRINYFEFVKPVRADMAAPCVLDVEIKVPEDQLEQDSDVACFHQRKNVSVTPLGWDLTCSFSGLTKDDKPKNKL